MSLENTATEERKGYKRWLLPVLLAVLLLLLLLTSWILLVRLGTFAASDSGSIFLVSAKPGFSVEDEEQTWGTETRFDLFKNEYYGIGHDITVKSEDGSRLIAPGTESEYTFNLKNTGNVALDYDVHIDVQLHLEGKELGLEDMPLGVRLRHYSGAYLLGDGEHWVSVAELENYVEKGTISVNNYAWYTIEWKWLFEENVVDDHDHLHLNVTDELDTMLGNISADTPISLSVAITTEAKPSVDTDAMGGVDRYVDDEKAITNDQIGGRIRLWPFILLLILVVAVSGTLGYVCAARLKKRKEPVGEGNA